MMPPRDSAVVSSNGPKMAAPNRPILSAPFQPISAAAARIASSMAGISDAGAPSGVSALTGESGGCSATPRSPAAPPTALLVLGLLVAVRRRRAA